MSQVILFDIDHTLLDTQALFERFHYRLYDLVGQPGVDVQPVLDRYWAQFARPQDFDWPGYEQYVIKTFGLDAAAVRAILYDEETYTQTLFPEVREVIAEVRAREYRCGVRSEGDPEFQQDKLRLSGLVGEFEPELVFISRDKNAQTEIERLPDATVIDDRLHSLTPLPSERFLRIWLNRREDSRPDEWLYQPMITSLRQLLEFL